ncbi:mechanosensitive ion channel family protein [Hyphobacterium marinum]|uniref:Mechanosensitive ion channel domain-containing protein n=1 Tax=Hyphobacterium marinum TaxID=3116574 RepID=A0ABU7M0J4_9PROT|nr:mechanosensitive ion channel domain-containing protein [Hyphobacterium sp. Y6023]MEE2567342.1 mechanosensitive ion channel domain-containing protein [Hyphobacterium sp. Y6023]
MSAPTETLSEAAVGEAVRLWDIVLDVWNTSFLGTSVGYGLVAILVLLFGLLVRGLLARWLIGLVLKVTSKTKTTLDDDFAEALSEPIKLVPVIAAFYIAILILGLDGTASPGERLIQSLIAVALFWSLHNLVTPFARSLGSLQRNLSPVMIDWTTKFFRIVFVVVGAAAVLEIWDIPVGPIVAGLGLFGVAVGLGAQDLFKNLIAGFLILTEKRFFPGDWIKVDGVVEGTVERINFRSTVVRRFDKGPVYVPNSELSDNAVVNFSRMTHRRISWVIGVEYKTTTEQLRQIRDGVLDYIESHEEFATPPDVTTFMRVDSFGPSSIDFKLYCFTKTTVWTEWMEIKERLAFAIKEIVEGAGTGFAFPSQTLYFDDGVEIFSPPSGPSVKRPEKVRPEDPDARFESDDGA